MKAAALAGNPAWCHSFLGKDPALCFGFVSCCFTRALSLRVTDDTSSCNPGWFVGVCQELSQGQSQEKSLQAVLSDPPSPPARWGLPHTSNVEVKKTPKIFQKRARKTQTSR